MAEKTELKKAGSLWKKQGKQGPFYSGYINIGDKEHSVLIFPNKPKDGQEVSPNAPNLTVFFTGDVKDAWKPKSEKTESKPKQAPKKAAQAPKETVEEDSNSELM